MFSLVCILLTENGTCNRSGHATEPACIGPICSALGAGGRLVLSGDPYQLGPLVLSKVAEGTLAKSLLSRLLQLPAYKRQENGNLDERVITKLMDR